MDHLISGVVLVLERHFHYSMLNPNSNSSTKILLKYSKITLDIIYSILYIKSMVRTKEKKMYLLIETPETYITVDTTKVTSFDHETIARFVTEQLGTDYLDWQACQYPRTKITEIDWTPLINRVRQEVTIKRKPRKYAIIF